MDTIGIQAIINIITQIFFILISFWSIQGIHFERFLPIREQQGKVLIVLSSVAIGYLCASFFLSLIDNIKNLTFLIS